MIAEPAYPRAWSVNVSSRKVWTIETRWGGAFDANFIKNASCDFTDTGAVTLTERVLTLEEFQINSEFCKKDFSQTWQAAEMGYSVLNSDLPASFQEFIVSNNKIIYCLNHH